MTTKNIGTNSDNLSTLKYDFIIDSRNFSDKKSISVFPETTHVILQALSYQNVGEQKQRIYTFIRHL